MSKIGHLFKTILISGLAVFISYLINYFLTKYITDNIGVDAYGFVSIAKNIVGYAGIITIALTSFIVRYIAVSYHKNDLLEANRYYSSSIAACLAVCAALIPLAAVVIWKLEYLINIPVPLRGSVKLLFVIIFINFILHTMVTPFSAAAVIKDRLDVVGVFRILSYLCDAGILILLFKIFNPSIWFVGIGSVTATVVVLISSFIMSKMLLPDLRFRKRDISGGKIKNLVGNGVYNSINSLGNTLNSGLDLLVSNLLLTGFQTGLIAIVKTLTTMFSTLIGTVFQPLQPRLIEAYSKRDTNGFVDELRKTIKISSLFSNLAFAGFVALGGLYYRLWLPNQDHHFLYVLTIIAAGSFITEGIMRPIYYVSTLTLKNKIPCWVTVGGGLLNVGSMFILLKTTNVGAYAVVGSTTVIMLGINLFFNPMYAARCLKTSVKPFYIEILRTVIATATMTAVFFGLSKLINPSNWIGLIATALLMVVIGGVIHMCIVFPFKDIKRMIRKVLRRA